MHITFTKSRDKNNEFDYSSVSLTTICPAVPDILDQFKAFLLACEFSPETIEKIQFVEEDDDN